MVGGALSWHHRIPYPPGGLTHKLENNYVTDVLPQEWEFWAPRQAPKSGGLASGGGTIKAFGFEGQWSLSAGALHNWGKQILRS